jgi:esterase
MQLAFKKLGNGNPLVILHGLYGSSDNWFSVGKELSQFFEVYMVDLRNHGKSPHAKEHDYFVMQNDIYEFFNGHKITKAILMGHSMGGKAAMFFAVNHPEMISHLIVVDISTKAYKNLQSPNKMALEHLNIINALISLDLGKVKSRTEIDSELSHYIRDDRVRQFLLKNVARNDEGNFNWLLNIDAIRNHLPDILNGIDEKKYAASKEQRNFPTLFLRGEKSEYIADEDLPIIKELFPRAEVVTIFGAGHWIHADQPETFIKALKYFLQI